MNNPFRDALLQAARLSRSGSSEAATHELQRALGGFRSGPGAAGSAAGSDAAPIDVEARVIDSDGGDNGTGASGRPPPTAGPGSHAPAAQAQFGPPEPDTFSVGSFANGAGRRDYKLYRPPALAGAAHAPALVVMLHGCDQDPDDFARGTRMNECAARRGWWVLYPKQDPAANGSGCWNWFKPSDQRRAGGEPEILAGMVRWIVEQHRLDPTRVFVAGLSAGGAMAATLATTHPELFAALGVHSGLPHGSASDVMSAMTAMRIGAASQSAPHRVPTIVFHGDADTTVHPSNGGEVIRQAREAAGAIAAATPEPAPCLGSGAGNLRCTRWLHRAPDGRVDAEHWLVHGSGHAWSGGSPAGSYTDPDGPDASAEMLRFFDEQRPNVASGAGAVR